MNGDEMLARLRDPSVFVVSKKEVAEYLEQLVVTNKAIEDKLKAIDALMVRRIKFHQEMKDLKGSGTAQKREHYKLHALSEALGEIRKVTKGKT